MKFFIKLTAVFLILSMLLISAVSCFSGNTRGNGEKTTTSGKHSESVSDPGLPDVQKEDSPLLEITEIMVQNSVGATAPDGQPHPWIELMAKESIDLSEYSLLYSDGSSYNLPKVSLKAGEYYLVFMYEDGFDITPDTSARLSLMHGDYLCQSLVYINRSENCSYIVKDGSESSTPTPGYENVLDADKLIITELMCDNSLYPIDGALCDWIEIFNAGEVDLLLSDYWASDKPDIPYLSRLPEVTLKPGEYLVLCGDRELSFGLSKSGETVLLTRKDGVTSCSVTYEPFDENCSYTSDLGICKTPSPGYPNGKDGMYRYISDRGGLVINEVISSNSKYKKYNADYYDIVEIFNGTSESVNLGEYYLSDKSSNLQRYKLPDVTIKPGAFQLIYCTGDGGGDPDFGISSKGEKIFLTKEGGYVCDALNVPMLLHNMSYGRFEGKLAYFETPTLGSANKSGFETMSAPPTSNFESGVYSGPISVTLSGEGSIYYTTDGTEPTVSSKIYKGESITFDKTSTLRMFCKGAGTVRSEEVSRSFAVGIPDYSLPLMMIAVENNSVFGSKGVYNTSEKTELVARATYLVDGNEEFSVGCGLKIFGGMTRFYKKKSFQLKFRGKYGSSTLDYKVFDDLATESFNSLVLRAGGQSLLNRLFNDEFATSLASTSKNMPSLLVQSYKPVNLYINDQYMGIYFMREKIDEDFVASHLGVSPDSVTVIDYMTDVKYGKNDAGWKELWTFINKNDLSVAENYKYVVDRVDIDSLIDFYIMEMWANNTDTGNVRVCRSTEGDGKWRFILFDLDLGFGTANSGASTYLEKYSFKAKPYNAMLWQLLKNDEFYNYFNERLEFHLSSTLSVENVTARVNFIQNQIAADMPYEIDRWKKENSNYNQSVSEWNTSVKSLLTRRATQTYIERFRSEVAEYVGKIRK